MLWILPLEENIRQERSLGSVVVQEIGLEQSNHPPQVERKTIGSESMIMITVDTSMVRTEPKKVI